MTATEPDHAIGPEDDLRARIPVFINSFEQLTYLRDTVDWFHTNGFHNLTVMDQGSVFGPLVGYFTSADFTRKARMQKLAKNIGPRRAVRKAAVHAGKGNPFIFTDPDLELPQPIAADFLTRLFLLGHRYAVPKVGLALDIYDAQKINLARRMGDANTIGGYYKRFFRNRLEPDVWGCGVDTTFFLHVPDPQKKHFGIRSSQPRIPAVRVGGPGFLAGHRPWYFDNGMPVEEEMHYRNRTTVASTLFGRAA